MKRRCTSLREIITIKLSSTRVKNTHTLRIVEKYYNKRYRYGKETGNCTSHTEMLRNIHTKFGDKVVGHVEESDGPENVPRRISPQTFHHIHQRRRGEAIVLAVLAVMWSLCYSVTIKLIS